MERKAALQDKSNKPLLYLADVRPLCREELMRRVYACVDERRRQKADACKAIHAKAASLAAGFLAEYALRQYEKAAGGTSAAGIGKCEFRIRYGEKGQPIVCPGERQGKDFERGPYVSLSHSGDYAVCAIAKVPVGVDIQKRQAVRSGMLRHFFTEEEELDFLRRYPAEECPEKRSGIPEEKKAFACLGEAAEAEFLRLWTIKESYMKLTGRGMGMGFAGICVEPERGIVWERKTAAPREQIKTCRIWEYAAPEGYFLSACAGCDGG